ncbi:MAG TPA: hypothetical protein VF170_16175 [Planctomycetaceae bacterium]
MRTRLSLPILVLAAAALAVPSAAWAQIEKPVRGKKYPLTPAHGPWMIMVASFNAPPPDQRTEGMTPEQAAEELVFELRSHKIPAYTFALDDKVESVETVDRLGEPDKRIYAAQRGSVCVLAGNYKSIDPETAGPSTRRDAETAVATLQWIKAFRPKFLSGGRPDAAGMVSLENGGTFRVTPSQNGPLAGAFFTTNPLRSADEIREQDPQRLDLLVKLNAGGDCSLYENKGKYTLVVASFYGNTLTLGGGKRSHVERFDASLGESLDEAAQNAWELARNMRQLKFDAYVWHDEYRSVVTVGSFDRADDPRIPTAIATYAAKMKPHAQTKQPILTAEYLTLPHNPTPQDPVRKKWIFDPQPRLMKVPKR